MISRFLTNDKEYDLIYLDINEIREDNTLIISINDTSDQSGYSSVLLTRDDIEDLIKVLKNKSKQMIG